MWSPPEDKDPILLQAPTRKSVASFGAANIRTSTLVSAFDLPLKGAPDSPPSGGPGARAGSVAVIDYKNSKMALRWTAAGFIEPQKSFNKIARLRRPQNPDKSFCLVTGAIQSDVS